MSKQSEAKKELLKRSIDKDSYLDKLMESRTKSKARVEADKKTAPVPKKKERKRSAFEHELSEVGPSLKSGIKDEFKKIKSLFKKDK